MSTVLVTGGSGFVGAHCILRLLDAGYAVRTTVRDLKREPDVRAMLRHGGVEAGERLSFAAADLTGDAGWPEAVAGCEFVLHVASPFPAGVPKDDDELIVPARDGALRVLRAARDAGVKRVVLTSSFAAVGYGHPPQAAPFDEASWTDVTAGVSAYVKSKTLAERAAWDFIAREGRSLELSAVNPVAIFGPVLGPDFSTSIALLKSLIDGMMAQGCPRIAFGAVDVRDVVDLHLRAMTSSGRQGRTLPRRRRRLHLDPRRCDVLRPQLGAAAAKLPRREIPDIVVRLGAIVNPMARQVLPELGKAKNATSEKARRLLGWSPRSREEAILASVESMARLSV